MLIPYFLFVFDFKIVQFLWQTVCGLEGESGKDRERNRKEGRGERGGEWKEGGREGEVREGKEV